jgi:pyruvate carboxylase subunit B
MKKEIKFSLIYRDMFQSSGQFQPRADQLARIAPVIIEMGCFARVETNGGAFEQVNLLYGENPNKAVRTFTKPFNEAGIRTHMLDRGLNALRMNPVPADVRRLMYKVKKAQGTDITRIFCGLNDVRNIIPSIHYAKEAGMIPQATLCITYSPVHTVAYYSGIADRLIEAGAPEICLKDMAGIGRPHFLGELVKDIKTKHPDILIQYHGHSGPGLSMASILEVCKAGADIIDTAIEPLSWGKIHPDIISVQAMLKDAGFKVADINMDAYMMARKLTQEFIDDFLGYFMDPSNKYVSSLLLGCGLPGGMMGSMMADLKGVMDAINMNRKNKGKEPYTEDQLLVKLFQEVAYVWPKVGYPPLVTPFSQYTKNIALMNILCESMGKPRYSMMDDAIWGMILGKSGKLPGEVAPEIVALAKEQGREFTTSEPQSYYPDELDKFRKIMKDEGWDEGEDQEELFELAMHERQYRDYRSGLAKQRFEADLQKAKDEALGKKGMSAEEILAIKHAKADAIKAPENGQIVWEISVVGPSTEPVVGTRFNEGDVICHITTPWNEIAPVKATISGKVVDISAKQGSTLRKGDPIVWIEKDA